MNKEHLGRNLEELVAHIEEIVADSGFSVVTNKKLYDEEDGQQLAEFDVIVEGEVGTNIIRVLFECRDRPSHGKEGADWIRSVHGRGDEFGFSKVVAVSGTGFTKGALKAASKLGVELRTVEEANSESIKEWLGFREIGLNKRRHDLVNVLFVISPDDVNDSTQGDVEGYLAGKSGNDLMLQSADGVVVSPRQAWVHALANVIGETIFDGIEVDGPVVRREYSVGYDKGEQYRLAIRQGVVAISKITFTVDLSIRRRVVPIDSVAMRRYKGTSNPIADVASFDLDDQDVSLRLSFSKMEDTSQTVVSIRRKS